MRTRLSNDFHGWLRRSFSLVALTGTLLMGGCTDDEVLNTEQDGNDEKFTFTAVAPTGTLSRALWNAEPANGKLGFNWEDTDKNMDLWQANETTVKTAGMSVNADDRSIVTITAESIDKEKDVYAFFPSGKVVINEGDLTLPCLLLQSELTQKGATTDHLRDYMYLAGALKTEELQGDEIPPMQLAHLCAVLRFKVQNGTNESVRVTKVEMLATEEDKGVNMLYALLAAAAPSNITVNVQDANDETKGHLLAAGGALSVYAHCFPTEVNDGQFQFRVTVTDADGNNQRVFLTREAFSTEGISTTKNNDASQKLFQAGYYYTFHLDIGSVGEDGRFAEVSTWTSGTVASESVSGEGTEASPYLIQSAEDLQWMINQVNNEKASSGKYYKLATYIHIDSDEENPWTPIGRENQPFQGMFDGDNYAIYGTMVADGYEQNSYMYYVSGFFGVAFPNTTGIIKNLHVKADVTCNYKTASDDIMSHVGGVVGAAYYDVSIENCTNSGNVTGCNGVSAYNATAGSIVGYVLVDLGAHGIIKNCSNYGSVTCASASNVRGTGGIAGCLSIGLNSTTSTLTVTGCINYGTIDDTNAGYYNYIGGLVGSNEAAVCICCKDESGYTNSGGTLTPIGTGLTQEQVEGCTGTHE